MSETSAYPLRLPKSLKDDAAKVAKHDHASINQFFAIAVAEKISVMEKEKLFTERAKQSHLDAFRDILFR